MNMTLFSEFEVVAVNIATQVFPNTQYQLLAQEIGTRELVLTFKSKKHFSKNFRIRFFPNNKKLIVSGYYKESIYHLNYLFANNYSWSDPVEDRVFSPQSLKEKFEFLAQKFLAVLEEFWLPSSLQ